MIRSSNKQIHPKIVYVELLSWRWHVFIVKDEIPASGWDVKDALYSVHDRDLEKFTVSKG